MLKIAYFSPLNPQRTGIADYSEELLPFLAQLAEIDLYVDGYTPANPELAERFAIFEYREFEARERERGYDISLYQMGNSAFHQYIYWTLAQHPGITVLHDFVLHHMVADVTVGKGDPATYVREMRYCHGLAGADAAREALRNGNRFPYLSFPANRRVLDASLGVIVHSDYVRSLVGEASPTLPVAKVPQHLFIRSASEDRFQLRHRVGIAPDELVFASFGLATPEKHLGQVLRAFKRVREIVPEARYVIVGDLPEWYDLRQIVVERGLEDAVRITGYVGKETMLDYVAAVDVAVALRWPTMGETSGSLLRLLGEGKPAIVSDVGSYAEIPDACCCKVPLGETGADKLAQAMLMLAKDPTLREEMGRQARHYVRENHLIERSAAQYIAFIEKVLA